MNPKIQQIRDDIERLQGELRNAMHDCSHINAPLYHHTSLDYEGKPYNYMCIVNCPDCGIRYTHYESDDEEDNKEYLKFKKIHESANN